MTGKTTVQPITFSMEDREAARTASQALTSLKGRGAVHVEAGAGGASRQSFVLPATAVRLLTDVLEKLANGRDVQFICSDATLTTQQAADMLNVSRPYLVRLLNEGRISYHLANRHRRIALRDLLAYREQRDRRSERVLNRLAAEAQERDLRY